MNVPRTALMIIWIGHVTKVERQNTSNLIKSSTVPGGGHFSSHNMMFWQQ